MWVARTPLPTAAPLRLFFQLAQNGLQDAAVHEVGHLVGRVEPDRRLEGLLAAVVVAGGETSGAVVGSLGVGLLTIGPLLAPGVCWSAAATDDGREVALVLKSGNFGAVDLFSSAWEVLA